MQAIKLNSRVITILGISSSVIGLILMADWQSIPYDSCTEFSLYHHPELASHVSNTSFPPCVLSSEGSLPHIADTTKSQSCNEAPEAAVSESPKVSDCDPIQLQRLSHQETNAPGEPSCSQNPEYLQSICTEETLPPAKASSPDSPAVLEGILHWKKIQRSLSHHKGCCHCATSICARVSCKAVLLCSQSFRNYSPSIRKGMVSKEDLHSNATFCYYSPSSHQELLSQATLYQTSEGHCLSPNLH